METKICAKCKEEFPLTKEYFYVDKTFKDGFTYMCKECKKKSTKQYKKENKEMDTEKQRLYRIKNKEICTLRSMTYYKKHREERLEYMRKYADNNKEACAIRNKKWRIKNKEFLKNTKKARMAKTKQFIALTVIQWETIKTVFNNKCCYCGKEAELNREHFVAFSKGGEYTNNNIIPSCQSCNSSKGNKDFFEWYPSYKGYSKKREKSILKYLRYEDNIQQLKII